GWRCGDLSNRKSIGFPAGVMLGAEEVKGDIRLVADDPTVVAGTDGEEIAGFHFVITAVVHPAGGGAGNDEADVLHFARTCAGRRSDVLGPFPARLVTRPADSHRTDFDDLELPLR